MDYDTIKSKLVEVLGKIQIAGGYTDAETIQDTTVPLEGLEGFDSKLAPIAIRRIARELDIQIPDKVNIFREGGKSKGRKLSVAEIAAAIVGSTNSLRQVAQ